MFDTLTEGSSTQVWLYEADLSDAELALLTEETEANRRRFPRVDEPSRPSILE